MADTIALRFVRTALNLRATHPQVPAVDVLEHAIKGVSARDFDFSADGEAFADWTDPDSPFGELLRAAFAAESIGPDAAAIWNGADDQAADALRLRWQHEVIEPLADRLGLWRG